MTRDVTAADLARVGVCLRMRLVPADARWLFEPLSTVARRAVGVGICRRRKS